MANSKAAKKALRTGSRNKIVNNSRKSRIRTFIKKVNDLIQNQEQEKAVAEFKTLQSEIMRGVSKGILHINNASRKLSKINAKIKNIATKKAAS